MKKWVKYTLVFLGALAILLTVQMGTIVYQVNYAKTKLDTYTSSDGAHRLVIYEIGEPDWPFGATHCRFVLSRGDKVVKKYNFSIADDGARAGSGNFSVRWQDDRVTVVVSGTEQRDTAYHLFFDGTVEEEAP